MNHCAAVQQQNALAAAAACEEMRSSVCVPRETVVCPKPHRPVHLNTGFNDPIRPWRWHFSHQLELSDQKAGLDLLDIILPKGGNGVDQPFAQLASSPPFFPGSPPSRASNPLIQDSRFGAENRTPFSPPSRLSAPPPPPSSTSRNGGCVRANFGNNPAVRVEGFDCLDRGRRNGSIPTLA